MSVSRILAEKGNDVFTLPPNTTTMDAVIAMREHKVGAMVIAGSDKKINGILSERDVVRALANKGRDALDEAVSAHMTSNVVTCNEAMSVHELMEKMTDGRFRHLPVEREGKLVGIISIGDVVKRRIAAAEAEAEEIKSYIASA